MTHLYGLPSGLSATRNPIQNTSANSCAGDQATFGAALAAFVKRTHTHAIYLPQGLLMLLVLLVSHAA